MTNARRRAALLLGCLCLTLAAGASARASVGGSLEEAKQTDFFRFFALVEDGARAAAPGGLTVASFRPRGGQFRQLVEVSLTLDGAGVVRAAELALARSFIDDPAKAVFARDVAKSFLRFAVPREDEAAVGDLANEIEFPKELEGYDIARAAPDPKLPAHPTAGYLVYLGKRPLYRRALSKGTLRLENLRAPGGDVLHVYVGPAAARRAR
jgi:hypothetical protein